MLTPKLLRILAWSALSAAACGGGQTKSVSEPSPTLPVPVRPARASSNENILFLEARLKNDPDDYIAHNKLASAYLQQMRETGDTTYLDLALRSAKASLSIIPAEQNKGGLAALAVAEFSLHDFVSSRDHALRLTQVDPNKGYTYQILGDALLELGQYDEAKAAFKEMEDLGGFQPLNQVAIEQRLSRMAALNGDTAKAGAYMRKALQIAEKPLGTTAEPIAWCQWQLGRMAFGTGDYATAEKYYNAALKTLPDYFGALGSIGHLRAARGDLPGAIENLEKVVSLRPDPAAIAGLADVYKLAGRDSDAQRQHVLLDEIARISAAKGGIYNRELSMFYANHDIKVAEACDATKKEYETRRDIYGADAVAWTCYKAGRMDEARAAMLDALRLGTKDAQLFYHAGMIEKAAGNKTEAKRRLTAALKLNPLFDLLQSENARTALRELEVK